MPRDRESPLSTVRSRAREKIAEDQLAVPAAVRPHLEAFARGLFEPGFDAATIAPEPEAQRQFRFALGVSPRIYCDRLLFDAARWLVCETELPVLAIAAGLGFAEPEAFSRWFKYRTGLSPMKLRAEARPPVVDAPASDRREKSVGDPVRSPRAWRHVLSGDSTAESGHALIRRLYEAYPEAREPSPTE